MSKNKGMSGWPEYQVLVVGTFDTEDEAKAAREQVLKERGL